MAKVTGKARCITCDKEKGAIRCEGCLQIFCRNHLTDHCQELSKQLDEIEIDRDLFQQILNERTDHPQKYSLIKQIDQWEEDSIHKIKQTADECRKVLLEHTNDHFKQIEINLAKLTDELKQTRQENDFNEIDINELKEKLAELTKELDQPSNISIEQDTVSFINKISVVLSSQPIVSPSSPINEINIKWKQDGFTIAGGNGSGDQLNQLYYPEGIYVDNNDQCIYIADYFNHRIVQWKYNAKNGQVVAGGNGKGNRLNQLNQPTDVILDKNNDSIIICDYGNRRVVRWSRRNAINGQLIISDIDCFRLTMDNNGELYVSDIEKNEVKKWKMREINGIVVAGGNGKGNQLNQLNFPTHIFVDEDYSVFISDSYNHRVMKWVKGAKEGIVVAGGQGKGDNLTQLYYPEGVIVDRLDNVFVADSGNHRIMCWSKGSQEGSIIVGGNGEGEQPNQFHRVRGLSFDRDANLYAVDNRNHRVQKFNSDSNENTLMI